MSDIFRIDTTDGIKLTGGVQQEGICTTVDSRDVRTKTELESGAQNAGGNDSSPTAGISEVYVTGCLTGSGTEVNPVSIVIDPTGGISCGPNGLLVTNMVVVTGVTASSVITSGCLTGSGIPGNPITVSLNPTGGLHCTAAGIALQQIYLTQAITSGCIGGIGTAGSPIILSINPTGGLHCTPGGLAVQFPAPTGLNNVSTSGSCLTGNGTAASPLTILFSPTGGIQCTAAGVALQQTYLTQAVTSGCVGGIGTAGSPIVLSINPTGGLQCTPGGLAISSSAISTVVTSGCVSGSGTSLSPIILFVNPTGGLQCTANGLAISQSLLSSTGGICTAWSYETGAAPLAPTQPTTPLTNLSSGNVQVEVYDSVIRFWFYNGSAFVLDKEFSGGGSGTGTPSSPVNSVQFNSAGSFGGSADLVWNGSALSVGGNGSSTTITSSTSALTASTPAITTSQIWNSNPVAFSGVVLNVTDSGSAATSKLLQARLNGNSRFYIQRDGLTVINGTGIAGQGEILNLTTSYGTASVRVGAGGQLVVGGSIAAVGPISAVTDTGSLSLGLLSDVNLYRDNAANTLALRNGGSSPHRLSLYNHYISNSVYERGVMDWVGSPGVLQIGTQHGGSGVPRGLQLITSGTPRIDIQAGGAIQFYGAYTFPSTNGSSGQVLTTNGGGTLSWGNVSGAATSDYFTGETNDGNSGSSITINFGTKTNHKLTLTANCALSFTAPADARETKIRFVQGGVGGYSITLPSGTLGDTPVLPTGVGAQSVVRFYYDGDGVWHV